MTVKEYLVQVFAIQKIINAKKTHIEYLKDMQGLFGTSFSKDGVKAKRKVDKTADAVIKIEKAKEDCENELLRLFSLQEEIKTLIESGTHGKHRLILYEHYILLKKWEQVARDTNYSESQVYKIHGEALKQLENIFTFTKDDSK